MKVYTLPVEDSGGPVLTGDGPLILLPEPIEPYILRFVVYAWSPIGHNASLYTNVPPDAKTEFEREKFYEFPLNHVFGKETYIDVKITKGGSYSYYFEYDFSQPEYFDSTASPQHFFEQTRTDEFYFIVQSGFKLKDKEVKHDALQIQSVMSKMMGPSKTWPDKLKAIADKGYNMVHFTPLQARGESDSPFSIFDQLKWDPVCFPNGVTDVESIVKDMENKYGLLSLTDVVLNHTANNSEWLIKHPECGYSIENSPHLNPALDLDNKLIEFSDNLEKLGLPSDLKSIEDLDRVIGAVRKYVLAPLKLWEYYVVDVDSTVKQALQLLDEPEKLPDVTVPSDFRKTLKSMAEFVKEYAGSNFEEEKFGSGRFLRQVDAEKLAAIGKSTNFQHPDVQFRRILDEINDRYYQEYDEESNIIISQLHDRTKYTRLESTGPKIGPITKKVPLGESYFTRITADNGKKIALVNNGWVWNGNPLVDFASNQSRAYLRREVIIWGDCVKLRYGKGPEDVPFLWKHMRQYVQTLAKYFHGFRIDNCHSTPLHVGQYFLDKARLVRPNLYVVAELFTGSENMDRIFVEKLGLNTVVREAMQAQSVQELSALCNKNGGRPIGSFSKMSLIKYGSNAHNQQTEDIHVVRSSSIQAWFMDCTHDNIFPAEKRTIEDTLPNAALVSMCACAVGSTVGYDECYLEAPQVVGEDRQFTFGGGISDLKRELYKIHFEMGQKEADECFIHHEGQYITIHRVEPQSGLGYFLIARTKFAEENDQVFSDIILEGTKAECILSVALKVKDLNVDDKNKLKGADTEIVNNLYPHVECSPDRNSSVIHAPSAKDFPPGSIALFKTHQYVVDADYYDLCKSDADKAVKDLNLTDLNALLYKVEVEEQEYGNGNDGVYDIPNFGKLAYAGLAGWILNLENIVAYNDLGAPICDNLRQGTWAGEYLVNRLYKYEKQLPNLTPVIQWLKIRLDKWKAIPSFLRPRFFTLIIYTLWQQSFDRFLELIPSAYHEASIFVQNLAITSVQMVGFSQKASLFPQKTVASMAAGLPHFSSGFMRCWGRDVFISVPGLLLNLQRYEEARNHIIGFAATLKHGLIPNLLDSGNNPRYNARDAVWFFLNVVKRYCETAPNGEDILHEKVARRFPKDDTWVSVDDKRAFSEESTLIEIVYEILQRHAAGIQFRESNAGPNLDSQMKDEGFNQNIFVDWDNGFVFGGNQWNCGTWMDKMGESERAGNKGYPGTPRDGAAVEITGLLKECLRWVNDLRKQNKFSWDHVVNQHGQKIKLEDWETLIQDNFERCYYIPTNTAEDKNYDILPDIVHRRGIYKDIYRSGKLYEDYQLRPNFAIAMCAAPELFSVKHACQAISLADRVLRGPVGMATLDPEDLNYRPYYNNGEDSTDFATSKGRNYHQGPEWVWLTGFFLRAMLYFDVKSRKNTKDDLYSALHNIKDRVHGHVQWLRTSPYAGLTELTNADGSYCADSSPTQAWSSATLLDLFRDGFTLTEQLKKLDV